MIGILHIGPMSAEIEAVKFVDGVMRLECTFGPDAFGAFVGSAWITDENGIVCWRSSRSHDYGVKTAADSQFGPSTWKITYAAHIGESECVMITETWPDRHGLAET